MGWQASGFYGVLKGRAYGLAQLTTGCNNVDAKARGFEDVFALLMFDSDHDRQAAFLSQLSSVLPVEEHRRTLLDGLAIEYARVGGWIEYVEKQTAT